MGDGVSRDADTPSDSGGAFSTDVRQQDDVSSWIINREPC